MSIHINKELSKNYFNIGIYYKQNICADDVLCILILSYVYDNINVIISRNIDTLKLCDICLHLKIIDFNSISTNIRLNSQLLWQKHGNKICEDFFTKDSNSIFLNMNKKISYISNSYLKFIKEFVTIDKEPFTIQNDLIEIVEIAQKIFERIIFTCIQNYEQKNDCKLKKRTV
ncbi:MAG: hypothetical protein N2749_04340 [Clostridia bacterium]|nr:hypothetical protein [Clostridia bacterium]